MTVQNTVVKNLYTGNGSTTVFPYTFALNDEDAEYVKVYITDTDGVTTATTDFTIDLEEEKVTYPASDADPLPSGYKIVLRRELPVTQELNLENQGAFFAEDIEAEMDREVMMIQQLSESMDRCIKVDASSSQTADELLADIYAKSAAAVSSASSAATSAASASDSATAAAASASDASDSADSAEESASSASASATSAASDAATATEKREDIEEAQEACEDAQTAAAASASAAAASESAAASSATAASGSATAAAGSATTASTAATSASNSASAAATSAAQAAASAHGGFSVGDIKPISYNGDIEEGWLLCDGASVSRTMYADLFAKIGTTWGAVDDTHFNLPNFTDNRFLEGSTTAGTEHEAGLPNITGTTAIRDGGTNLVNAVDGAFYSSDSSSNFGAHFSAWQTTNAKKEMFDASRSSSIYGNSTTVQPKSATVRIIIKAFDGQTHDSALIDVTQYANELNRKQDKLADTVDYVVDSYADANGSWWRRYKSGWLEQGLFYDKGSNVANMSGTLTWVKEFANTDYFSTFDVGNSLAGYTLNVKGGSKKTTTTVTYEAYGYTSSDKVRYVRFYACGQGATE